MTLPANGRLVVAAAVSDGFIAGLAPRSRVMYQHELRRLLSYCPPSRLPQLTGVDLGFHDDPYESLTDREKHVLKLVAEGSTNKEIVQTLDISVKTAMTHREHLMDKLGLHTSVDLVKFAVRRGVIRV